MSNRADSEFANSEAPKLKHSERVRNTKPGTEKKSSKKKSPHPKKRAAPKSSNDERTVRSESKVNMSNRVRKGEKF